MKTIKDTQKKYCSKAMALSIVASIALLVIGMKPSAKGIVLGTVFSIINFVLIGQSILIRYSTSHSLTHSRKKLFVLSFLSIGVRFSLLAVPLIIAAKSDKFDIISTIAGLFMIQLIILLSNVYNMLPSFKKKKPA